jgi:hypothetical protein
LTKGLAVGRRRCDKPHIDYGIKETIVWPSPFVLMAGEAILLSGAKFPRVAPGGSTIIATDSVKRAAISTYPA